MTSPLARGAREPAEKRHDCGHPRSSCPTFAPLESLEPRLLLSAVEPGQVRPYYDEAYYLAHNPGVQQAVADGWFADGFEHYFTRGMHEDRRPSLLFDPAYYQQQHPDAPGDCDSLMSHYIQQGASLGYSPTPWFEESYYLARNPDVGQAVSGGWFLSGFEHFMKLGRYEFGRDPIRLFNSQYYRNRYQASGTFQGFLSVGLAAGHVPTPFFESDFYPESFEHFVYHGYAEGWVPTPLFDAAYYAQRYPDAPGSYDSLYEHFLEAGIPQGYSPSVWYNEQYYLSCNADVALAVAGPAFRSGYEHFVRFGRYEVRDPIRLFDSGYYRNRYGVGTFDYFLDVGLAAGHVPTPFFESDFYPLSFEHFVVHGYAEGWVPTPLFDPAYYAERYPDAPGEFDSLYQHFLEEGVPRGYSPSIWYNEGYYLRRNADVRQAVNNHVYRGGYEHFVRHGRYERRSAMPLFHAQYYADEYGGASFDYFLDVGRQAGHVPTFLFDEEYYLGKNEDLRPLPANYYSGYDHYIRDGMAEGRSTPTPYFDESYYLTAYPEVAAAVAGGFLDSGYEHFIAYGFWERRAPCRLLVEQNLDAGGYYSGFEQYVRVGHLQGEPQPMDAGALSRPRPAEPVFPAEVGTEEYLNARFSQVISVADHGSVGDGMADDTSAIVSAIAAAGPGDAVFFPAGTYAVTHPVTINGKTDLTLIGPEATIQYHATQWTSEWIQIFSLVDCPRIHFDYLTFDGIHRDWGDVLPPHDWMVLFNPGTADGSHGAKVTNCKFFNMDRTPPSEPVGEQTDRYAAAVGIADVRPESAGILVENNYFQDMEGGAVWTRGQDTVIRGNTMVNLDASRCDVSIAITNPTCTGAVIEGNYVEGWITWSAIAVERGASQYTITDNFVRNCKHLLIFWGGLETEVKPHSYGGTVSNNILDGTSTMGDGNHVGEGILLDPYYHDVVFTGNILSGIHNSIIATGIRVQGTGHTFNGNTFFMSDAGHGFRLAGCADCTISENLLCWLDDDGASARGIMVTADSDNAGVTISANRFERGDMAFAVGWEPGGTVTGMLQNNVVYGMKGYYIDGPLGTAEFDVNFDHTIVLS